MRELSTSSRAPSGAILARMRRHGTVHTATGLGLQGHGCWTYSDESEYKRGILEYLADGLDLGQRLLYVGGGGVVKLHRDLDDLPGVEDMLGDGILRIMPLESVYEVGRPIDPMAQLTMYAAAVETALQDGYRGLRVAAEVTPLVVVDPELWPSHTRWESVADRYMAKNPMSALCCYDRRVLPDSILADLSSVHRTCNAPPETVPFRLYAGREGLSLAGEVDSFSAEHLRRLLPLASPPRGDLVLELDELEFIDHHGVLAIADHARALERDGRSLNTLGAPPEFDRLTHLLRVAL
jgi:anti-anti-sigma regulatory factor